MENKNMSFNLIDTKAEAIAIKGVRDVIKTAGKVHKILKGDFQIVDNGIVVKCPELTQRYNILFKTSGGVIGQKVKFPLGRPIRVGLTTTESLQEINDAVYIDNDGFYILTKNLSKNSIYNLKVEYQIKHRRFIDNLVETNNAKELPKGEKSEYWMQAELTYPKIFKTNYGKLDIRDFDFCVNVGVSEDLKTIFSPTFRREIQTGMDLVKETDLHKARRMADHHVHAMRQRGKKQSAEEALSDIQELFTKKIFETFIDVTGDFYLDDVLKGINYYDPTLFQNWPKFMTTISRTDLNLDKFTAEGKVIYKKADFLMRMRKILGI
jgi:hypothetical protein